MQSELEGGHNPEVAPTAADTPEQIRVFGCIGRQHPAIGRHDVDREEVVDGQAVFAHQPADATTQCQTREARSSDGASRGRKSKFLCPGNEFKQPEPGLSARSTLNGVDRDAFHLREIDDDTAITDRVARRTMPATAYSNRKVLAAREFNCTHNIGVIRASNNEGRIAVNQSIPDPASAAVAIAARIEHFATQPGLELLKRSQVHSLRSCLPCLVRFDVWFEDRCQSAKVFPDGL